MKVAICCIICPEGFRIFGGVDAPTADETLQKIKEYRHKIGRG